MAVDITSLPAPPPSAPLAATDLVFIGRPAGTPGVSSSYAMTAGQLAPALVGMAFSPVLATALGSDQASAGLLTAQACNIITGGGAGTGVRLPIGAGQGVTVMNNLAVAQLLYPPIVLNAAGTGYMNTSINGQAAGQPASIPPNVEVNARTVDGLSWFVG